MKFSDIENIWTVDLLILSNADRGRVYFERAKQVVGEALSDPVKRDQAVRGKRFRRAYLVEEIGCQPAVTSQNPKIRQLLVEIDHQISQSNKSICGADFHFPQNRLSKVAETKATTDSIKPHRTAGDGSTL